ncbi:MAG: hypothetical protein N0E58_08935 [Candidatus Thiodiazotropha endolucinida]|uniref:Uncharacterized protein n=1 Tax=Candidatus Thiodiazotropha taylori TaxID=2792791 RepID=A0A9E4NJY8_9GAMM|nr:hypothetical protein [Candidatus Thiodiazotropha taylori]MCW4236378.1 hypothetical protein [Candidatus Thiodiazotropha endolucinida]
MPKVSRPAQTARPIVTPPQLYGHQQISPDQISGGAGDRLIQQGQIEHKRAMELKLSEEETLAKSVDADFSQDLRTLLDDPDTGYYNQRGQNAYQNRADVANQIKDLKTKYLRQFKPGSVSAQLFTQVAERRVESSLNGLFSHASKEFRRWQDDAYDARIKASIDDAVTGIRDPKLIRQAIATGKAEEIEYAQRHGLDPDSRDIRVLDFTTKLHSAVIDRIGSGNLVAAQDYYRANIDEIDPTARTVIEKQFRSIANRRREKVASDLELRVYGGNGSEDEINAAFDSELISGPKRTQLLKELSRQAGETASAQQREYLISTGLPLDPKDKKHRQAVDEAFVRLGSSSPVAIALTKQTGILPGQVRAVFRTAARSGEGPAVKEALKLYAAIDDQVPLALDDLSISDIAVLENATQLIRGGLPSGKAMEIARQQSNIPEAERKVMLERYQEQAKKNPDSLQDALDSDDAYDTELFSGAPKPPAAMQADYERLVETFYTQLGGDIEQAQELSFKTLKRTWTRTDINGDGELMRYSPEFDLNVSTKVLRKDLNKQLEEIKVKPESVRVISDVLTVRSKRGQRSYALVKTRPDGLPEILRGPNNMPLRWVPDPYSVLNRQHRDSLSRAKRARQQHQQAQRVRQHFPDGG